MFYMTYFIEKIESSFHLFLVDEDVFVDSCHAELRVSNSQVLLIHFLLMAAV